MANTTSRAADPAHQRRVYARRYARPRALRDWLRYDARYRLLLLEEVFREHDIPFERQRVYELGFGTGSLLLRFDTTCTLHGAEISESAVHALSLDARISDYRAARFASCAGDGTPPFFADDYDVMIASHVLEHVPDDLATLRLMAKHTRPGGHGVFFLPLERPRHNPDHARTYTKAGFCRLLELAGYTPLHVSENFRYASHFVQVFNWPSRRRIPLLGPLVEAIKNLLLALPPTGLVRLLEEPLARLRVRPYQLMVLARRAGVGST